MVYLSGLDWYRPAVGRPYYTLQTGAMGPSGYHFLCVYHLYKYIGVLTSWSAHQALPNAHGSPAQPPLGVCA